MANKKQREKKSFHEVLEGYNPLLGTILAIALAIKSSYLWSFGSIDITKFPGGVGTILNVLSAISIAVSAETLSINSGAHSWRTWRTMHDLDMDTGYNKRSRAAMRAKLGSETVLHGVFALIGVAASSFAMVYFALKHVAGGDGVGDVIIAVFIQVLVIYIGVFFEPTQVDPYRKLGSQISHAVSDILDQFAEDIKHGNYDNAKIMMMQRSAPKEMRGLLDGLIKNDGLAKMWNTTEIVNFLLSRLPQTEREMQFDTTQRDVRNWLTKVSNDPLFGIRPADKGRGLVIPGDKMFILFQDPIERVIRGEKPFTHGRKRPARHAAASQVRNDQPTETEAMPPSDGTSPASNGNQPSAEPLPGMGQAAPAWGRGVL